MKIQALSQTLTQGLKTSPALPLNNAPTGLDFKQVLQNLKNFVGQDQLDLKTIETQFANNKSFNPKELLSFQYRMSNHHVRVEMVGKIVESALSASKRLQQVQ